MRRSESGCISAQHAPSTNGTKSLVMCVERQARPQRCRGTLWSIGYNGLDAHILEWNQSIDLIPPSCYKFITSSATPHSNSNRTNPFGTLAAGFIRLVKNQCPTPFLISILRLFYVRSNTFSF